MPREEDPRVEELVVLYTVAAQELASKLDALVDTEESPARLLIFNQILGQLEELQADTRTWADEHVPTFYREADQEALAAARRLRQIKGFPIPLGATINEDAIKELVDHINGHLGNALNSVKDLTRRVFRSTALERTFPELDTRVRTDVAAGLAQAEATREIRNRIKQSLKKQFRDNVVTIRDRNGRNRRFALPYYANIVANSTRAQAMAAATLNRANESDADLVRISSNRSLTKDYCDAYAGRIYSLNGKTPGVPLLDSIPFGPPPFHPWCRHTMSIYVPEFHSPEDTANFAQTDERFLHQDVGPPNRREVIRNWWKAVDAGNAPLPTTSR